MFLRIYGVLLGLYPKHIRRRYGGEMVRLMCDARAEAKASGRVDTARFYARTVRDVLVNGLLERWGGHKGQAHGNQGWEAGMQALIQDFRYALRAFRKRPVMVAIGVLTLAVGIGGNTLIFSVVDAVLVQPLPYDSPDRVVILSRRAPNEEGAVPRGGYSDPAFLALEQANRGFDALAAYSTFPLAAGGEDRPFQTTATLATPGLWEVLGVSAIHGRVFGASDAASGADPVVVLSHGLWLSRYGGEPSVVGSSLTIGTQARTIIGVMPRDFVFLDESVEAWVPLSIDPSAFVANSAVNNNRAVVGRIPDASDEIVTASLAATQRGAIALRPDAFAEGETLLVTPLLEFEVGSLRTTLFTLLGAVAFVLLIACANLANLLLIQAEGRSREFAIRASLGAGRVRIVRQLLSESLLLAAAGATVGLAVAYVGLNAVKAMAPVTIPRLGGAHLSGSVLAFTLLLTMLTGLLFGLVPVVATLRADLRSNLSGSGAGGAVGRGRVRGALVVAEVAVTLVLMVGAGLLLNSFWRLQQVEPGFDPEDRLVAQLLFPPGRYNTDAELHTLYDEMTRRLDAIPGVLSSAYTFLLPMQATSNWWVQIENREDEGVAFVDYDLVTSSYFETMGVPLVQGRVFDQAEATGDRSAVILSESVAERLFPDDNPIGQRLNMNMPPNPVWREVVGVVGDVRGNALSVEAGGQMYFPPVTLPLATPAFGGTLVIRTSADATGVSGLVRRAVAEVAPSVPVGGIRSLEEVVMGSEGERRFVMWLLMSFAGAALLLAVVGLYGVLSYSVALRTREFGIRMALGATPEAMVRYVVSHGAALAGAGALLGLGAAVWLTRLLQGLLFEVAPLDAATYVGVAALLVGVAVATTGLPARRATRIDPVRALSAE